MIKFICQEAKNPVGGGGAPGPRRGPGAGGGGGGGAGGGHVAITWDLLP